MPGRKYTLVLLRLNLILAFVEGWVVFWNLSSVSSEEGSFFFLGYSLPRLILLGVVLVMAGVIAWLFARSFHTADPKTLIENLFSRAEVFWILLALGGAAYFLIFASDRTLGEFNSYRIRLSPILVWVGLICLQSLLVFIPLRAIGSGLVQSHRGVLLPAGIVLVLLAALIAFVSLTRIGLTPDRIYWQGAGVPLLIHQVILALAIGMLIKVLADRFGGSNRARINAIACIGIWLVAVVLWWSQPARTSYNTLEPGPPNFQGYPFGDAILYDTSAHDFLAGTALPNDFWVKPLYSVFLAFLHLFSGENYASLILLQISILAIIPVLVYLLVRMIGNRHAGIVAGILVILREQNAIALSNVIQVSHLKLLLSDVFSMGLVVLLLWLMFRWFERPEDRQTVPMMIGWSLGLLVLTRGHPVLLFPLIALVIFFFRAASLRQRIQRAGLFVAGVMLVLIPWFWRIYETTGRFALQSPVSPYSANMAGLYSLTPRLANPDVFTTDVSSQTLEQSDLQNKQVMEFILQHPDEVLRFVSAHYFHNVIFSYIYLPQSFRIESLRAYVTVEPFWGPWLGDLSVQGRILLFLNIGLIALGIGAAWRKHKIPAVIPLLMGMGYNASVSVGRISGWRFIQPADWITLIYFSLGLIQVSYLIGFLLTGKAQEFPSAGESRSAHRGIPHSLQIAGFAIFFLLIGMVVPYGNRVFAWRYPETPAGQLLAEYVSATRNLSQRYSADDLVNFLQEDRARILHGQAIYPYYLESDAGPINHFWPAYKPRSYNRLVFYLSGSESGNVVLPLSSSDFTFPDGSDVIVLGCVNDSDDIEALSVLIMGETPGLYSREPLTTLTCPLPEPR